MTGLCGTVDRVQKFVPPVRIRPNKDKGFIYTELDFSDVLPLSVLIVARKNPPQITKCF